MMSKWISLQRASELYKIPEKVFYNIIEEGTITCSKIGTKILVENIELENYLKQHAHLLHAGEKEEWIKVVKEDPDREIKEAKKYDPSIFQLFIEEISMLIEDTRKRALFLDASIDGNIKRIASKYNLEQRAAWYQYNSAKKMVAERIGIMRSYRKEKASLLLMNRRLQIQMNNLKNENEQLKEIIREQRLIREDELDAKQQEREIGNEVIRILSSSLTGNYGMSKRLLNCMHSRGLKTMEDLLRFIKLNGFIGLYTIRSYGKKCERELKECLLKANIIDKDGHIELLDYLK